MLQDAPQSPTSHDENKYALPTEIKIHDPTFIAQEQKIERLNIAYDVLAENIRNNKNLLQKEQKYEQDLLIKKIENDEQTLRGLRQQLATENKRFDWLKKCPNELFALLKKANDQQLPNKETDYKTNKISDPEQLTDRFDLTYLSISNDDAIQKWLQEHKDFAEKPVLFKKKQFRQGQPMVMQGISKNDRWELNYQLDSKKFKSLTFTDQPQVLPSHTMSDEIYREIISKHAHATDLETQLINKDIPSLFDDKNNLQRKELINQVNYHGEIPLWLAFQAKLYRVATFLIEEYKEDQHLFVDSQGQNILHVIAGFRIDKKHHMTMGSLFSQLHNEKVFPLLLWQADKIHGDYPVQTAVRKAAYTQQTEILDTLLGYHLDPQLLAKQTVSILQVTNNEGETALHIALQIHGLFGTGLPVIEKLLGYCQIFRLAENAVKPDDVSLNTLLLQTTQIDHKEFLTAYYTKEGAVREKSIAKEKIADLVKQLPAPGQAIEDPRLLEKIIQKYDLTQWLGTQCHLCPIHLPDRDGVTAFAWAKLLCEPKRKIITLSVQHALPSHKAWDKRALYLILNTHPKISVEVHWFTGREFHHKSLTLEESKKLQSYFPSAEDKPLELSADQFAIVRTKAQLLEIATQPSALRGEAALQRLQQAQSRYRQQLRDWGFSPAEQSLDQKSVPVADHSQLGHHYHELIAQEFKADTETLLYQRYQSVYQPIFSYHPEQKELPILILDPTTLDKDIQLVTKTINTCESKQLPTLVDNEPLKSLLPQLLFYRELQQRLIDLKNFPRLFLTYGLEAHAWSALLSRPQESLETPLLEIKAPPLTPVFLPGIEAVRESVRQALLRAKQIASDSKQQTSQTLADLLSLFGQATMRADLISCFDWSQVSTAHQQKLLHHLFNQSFPQLKLKHCQVLVTVWQALFQQNAQLTVLEIIDGQLTPLELMQLARYCPRLETLILHRVEIKGIYQSDNRNSLQLLRFPKLRTLELIACPTLYQIWCDAPELQELDVSECNDLKELHLNTPLLTSLGCRQTRQLFTLECKAGPLSALARDLTTINRSQIALATWLSSLRKGSTQLHGAALDGELAVIRWLIDLEIDVNSTEEKTGETPLHKAAASGHLAAVKYLLVCRALINTCDLIGKNALHHAIANQHLNLALYLCSETTIEKNVVDHQGQTPSTLFRRQPSTEREKYSDLENHMALN